MRHLYINVLFIFLFFILFYSKTTTRTTNTANEWHYSSDFYQPHKYLRKQMFKLIACGKVPKMELFYFFTEFSSLTYNAPIAPIEYKPLTRWNHKQKKWING